LTDNYSVVLIQHNGLDPIKLVKQSPSNFIVILVCW